MSSFYGRLVQDGSAQDVARVFPWRGIWLPSSPSKVAIFVWIASLGGVLTIDNLIRRWHIFGKLGFVCAVGQ